MPTAGAYAKRTNAGQVVTATNTKLPIRGAFEPSEAKPLGQRCSVTVNSTDFQNISTRYRYMYTTLDERARALDKHLLHLQSKMCETARIPEEVLQPVGIPSQDTVWVCGRICCEAAEGRINAQSVMLEGSRRDSQGRRVRLKLDEMQYYSLFPGQIVLVEGLCGDGRTMVAKRIMEGCPLSPLQSTPQQLLEFHHGDSAQGGKPLSVFVASGPFTTSDNLNYAPLDDLILKVLKEKPDVLILVGPFVDVSQPLLNTGNIKLDNDEEVGGTHDATYEMVFIEKIVRDGLQSMFASEGEFGGPLPTNVILVPSLLDAHHEYVFPQPPFGDRDRIETNFFTEDLGVLNIPFSNEKDPKRRVHLMPNPCMFRMNEVLFGVSSNDVLFSLSTDEVSKSIDGNRVARLATHLLQQQSFSPQFPVPPSTVAQQDLRQARHWEFTGAQPDILILPSRLAAMVKEAQGSLMINTGQLSKGTGGGTYAELSVNPVPEKELRDAAMKGQKEYPHNVCERTAVKIVRI